MTDSHFIPLTEKFFSSSISNIKTLKNFKKKYLLSKAFQLCKKTRQPTSPNHNKINKIDIVGFLSNKGMLKKDDIGLIEVKDFFSFVAVRKLKVGEALELVKDEKIKNKKVKIAIAK